MTAPLGSTDTYDIVIAGGGLVGLTQALMLVQELPHLNVAVVEKLSMKSTPAGASFDSRSTAVSAGSVELLEALGVWGSIAAASATPIRMVDVSDRGHLGRTRYGVENHPAQAALDALGFVVDNISLGRALQARIDECPTITQMCPAELVAVHPKAEYVQLDVVCRDQGEAPRPISVVTQLLIVADGAESGLREKLGIGAEVSDYGQHAVVANVHHSNAHQCVAFERFTEQGPMALLPMGGSERANQSALVWTRPVDKLDETLTYNDTEFLSQLQHVFGYRLGTFEKVSTRHHYPLKLSIAKEQIRTGLVLVGNAAHFLHPVAGQGFNLAVRDCAQLTAALAAATRKGQRLGAFTTLQSYMATQTRDQFATTMLSHSFNSLFSNNRKPLQLLRNLGLLGLQALPSAQGDFFNQMMGRGMARAELNLLQRHLLQKQSVSHRGEPQ